MNFIELLLAKIEARDSKHASKLRRNLGELGDSYYLLGNAFYKKYYDYLISHGLTLDYSVDCYFRMVGDMIELRIKFVEEGRYANSSFAEVDASVYANPEVMSYHMHGLVLAQFLWFDQYERIKFFVDNVSSWSRPNCRYLEIGGGHGLYLNEALKHLSVNTQFDMVDISESSLELAKGILQAKNVNYILKNINDFTHSEEYDFVTIGEVLEHVEQPLQLLRKIKNHLSPEGGCYVTTPVNAPMIDHIYLFNDVQEIRDVIWDAGFQISFEKIVISEKVSPEKAAKFKVPIMYAAFLKMRLPN